MSGDTKLEIPDRLTDGEIVALSVRAFHADALVLLKRIAEQLGCGVQHLGDGLSAAVTAELERRAKTREALRAELQPMVNLFAQFFPAKPTEPKE